MKKYLTILISIVMIVGMMLCCTGCGNKLEGSYVSTGDGIYWSDDYKEQLDKDVSLEYISEENAGDSVLIIRDDGMCTYEGYGSTSEYTYSKTETLELDGTSFDVYELSSDGASGGQLLIPADKSTINGNDLVMNMGGILIYFKQQ